jgi:hypothetical protein
MDIDQVTREASAGQSSDLGADDVVEGKYRPPWRRVRRSAEGLTKYVELALLT